MTTNSTQSPSELLPCPFCGADAYLGSGVEERDDRRYFSMTVCCGSCEASITEAINFIEYRKLGERGTYQRLMEMCSAAWNTRTSQPAPDVVGGRCPVKQVHDYVKGILITFQVDRPDSMYQAGYEAATKDICREIERVIDSG